MTAGPGEIGSTHAELRYFEPSHSRVGARVFLERGRREKTPIARQNAPNPA